jgi:hypothetical protein
MDCGGHLCVDAALVLKGKDQSQSGGDAKMPPHSKSSDVALDQ